MSLRCLFGFHKWPKGQHSADFDIFRYLLQRCERCGKKRRDTFGPLGS